MNAKYKVGDNVVRVGSPKDYTTGRTGIIVKINTPVAHWPLRYRVKWTDNGIRTWVKEDGIKLKQ